MRDAIDIFWGFGVLCLIWATVSPFRYPDTTRFFRAMNFAPAKLSLRTFCGMSAVRGIADLAARYDNPWLLTHLKSVPFNTALALVLLVLWALIGYAIFAKSVQQTKKVATF